MLFVFSTSDIRTDTVRNRIHISSLNAMIAKTCSQFRQQDDQYFLNFYFFRLNRIRFYFDFLKISLNEYLNNLGLLKKMFKIHLQCRNLYIQKYLCMYIYLCLYPCMCLLNLFAIKYIFLAEL